MNNIIIPGKNISDITVWTFHRHRNSMLINIQALFFFISFPISVYLWNNYYQHVCMEKMCSEMIEMVTSVTL